MTLLLQTDQTSEVVRTPYSPEPIDDSRRQEAGRTGRSAISVQDGPTPFRPETEKRESSVEFTAGECYFHSSPRGLGVPFSRGPESSFWEFSTLLRKRCPNGLSRDASRAGERT
ncbi:hypothetical protein [Streptomyces sp. NPDC059701]|uniref:hypothetical protein n=1 Tax=Streptomyces sp. NPDC059701 TaxID=3346914 RepID=UPI00368B852D